MKRRIGFFVAGGTLFAVMRLSALACLSGAELAGQEASTSADVAYEEGKDLFQSQSHRKAITAFTRAIESPQKRTLAYANRARSHLRLGEFDKATADVSQAIRLADAAVRERPLAAGPFEERAWVYIVRSEMLSAASKKSTKEDLQRDSGRELEKAASDLARAMAIEPKRAKTMELRAYVLFELERWGPLISLCDAALEHDDRETDYYRYRAHARFRTGDIAGAIKDCNAVLVVNPDSSGVLRLRGTVRRFSRQYAEAIQDFDSAIRLDSRDAMAYQGRAMVYLDQGDIESALADVGTAVGIDPASVVTAATANNVCRSLSSQDQSTAREMLPFLERICSLAPQQGDCFLMRAWGYQKAGNSAKASRDYERARQLGVSPATRHAAEWLMALLEGESEPRGWTIEGGLLGHGRTGGPDPQ